MFYNFTVDIFLLLYSEDLHSLPVKACHLILGGTEVRSKHIGAVNAQVVAVTYNLNSEARNIPKLIHNLIHILDEFFVAALTGIALCAKQMVRSQF